MPLYSTNLANYDRMIDLWNERVYKINKELRAKGCLEQKMKPYHDYNDPAKTKNWHNRLENEKIAEKFIRGTFSYLESSHTLPSYIDMTPELKVGDHYELPTPKISSAPAMN